MSVTLTRRIGILTAVLLTVAFWPSANPAAQSREITSRGDGPWDSPGTWSCQCVPAAADRIVIRGGDEVTVRGQSTARSVAVEGVLRASRTADSTLVLSGNLVVRGSGWLDFGTPAAPMPAGVTARIRFVLDEARYRGGAADIPLDTDVGLWAIERGRVSTRGPSRDAWSLLAASARAGTREIRVDPRYAAGWRAGDELLIGPSKTPRNREDTVDDEVRRIVADLGGGQYRLDQPLLYDHLVQTLQWRDAWGDDWTEALAPPVANLTRNVVFEAADPNHRPHLIFLDAARAELEDLAIQTFSPVPRFDRFGRYALHFHMQQEGSRGSHARRVVIRGGRGDGLHIHESSGVVVEDLVVFDQSATGALGIMLEEARDSSGVAIPDSGATDAWIDRPLMVKVGGIGSSGGRTFGIWLGGGVGAYVVGSHAAGGRAGAGIHWPEGRGNNRGANPANPDRTPRVLRAVTHSSLQGFFWWQNTTPAQDVLDLLAWGNRIGVDIGAYGTNYWLYGARAVGNTVTQFTNHANGTAVTNFLADGRNLGGDGIIIDRYIFESTRDSLYEGGVVRGAATAAGFHDCLSVTRTCGSATTHVQFSYVEFADNPLLRFDWHPQVGTYLRIRNQTGLTRPRNFTLYRPGLRIAGGTFDAAFDATRVDNDTAGATLRPPRVRFVAGAPYGGCVADDARMAGTTTLCAETDAPRVTFWAANQRIVQVNSSGGLAQATFDMRTWPHLRAYFYAQAEGANGRINYSRVIRVQKASIAAPAAAETPGAGSAPVARAPSPAPAPKPAPAAPTASSSPRPGGDTARPGAPPAAPSPAPTRLATPPAGNDRSPLIAVVAGTFPHRSLADKEMAALRAKGFAPYIVRVGPAFQVRLGAFTVRSNAERLAAAARAKGFAVRLVQVPAPP